MIKIAIIHFKPFSGYPPVINLYNYLKDSEQVKVKCLTTRNKDLYSDKLNLGKGIKFLTDFGGKPIKPVRLLKYIQFYVLSIIHLIKFNPDYIIYYDTVSNIPAWIYKLIYKQTGIYVHYHEYLTLKETISGMLLNRIAFYFENKFLHKAEWLSHTNRHRLNFFVNDRKSISFNNVDLKVLPNYPSRNWTKKIFSSDFHHASNKKIIKLVYVGYSMTFDTMYTRELIDFVASHQDSYSLDCYIFKKPPELMDYTKNISNVNIYDSVPYQELPYSLMAYDTGLIIYKPHVTNYIYNAPNKLFEYYNCGLNVIFPKEMVGCQDYINTEGNSLLLDIDFKNIEDESYKFKQLKRTNKLNLKNGYFAEDVYSELINHMIENRLV